MVERNSKDLLHLEANSAKSKLLVCEKDLFSSRSPSARKTFSLPEAPLEKPTMLPLPKSQVLGKVKDFLGVISESNKKMLQEATENPDSYDIEVLSGKESEYIEMDLMLGVADLHTPEAVAAAESAMAGYQVVGVALSEDEDEGNEENTINEQQDNGSEDAEGDSSCKKSRKRKYKLEKQPKIVELS